MYVYNIYIYIYYIYIHTYIHIIYIHTYIHTYIHREREREREREMMEMIQKTMTCLKMCHTSYPMVFSVNYFSNFYDTLEHFNEI